MDLETMLLLMVTHKGQWKDDEKSGNETFIWTDGDKYVGEWENGFVNGFGKYTFTDGRIYEGQSKDNKKSGNGHFIWPNGDKYAGEWENDLPNGSGIVYSSNGEILKQGQWKEGIFIF